LYLATLLQKKLSRVTKMKRTNTQGISDLIQLMKKQYKLENGMNKAEIRRKWDSIVGPTAAKLTDNIYFKNDIMFVILKSPILRHELSGQRDKLKQRINEHFGHEFIKEIVLK
jgi:hypothetical protein